MLEGGLMVTARGFDERRAGRAPDRLFLLTPPQPPRSDANLETLDNLQTGLFTAIVGTMGAKFVIELMSTDQVSPDLELPSWIVYACIPLGSYLMSFRFLQVAWAFWKTGELPHHDATNVDGIEVSPTAPVALGEA